MSKWSFLSLFIILEFLSVITGTGFELPAVAANALNMAPPAPAVVGGPPAVPGGGAAAAAAQAATAPPIATQCFMLSNMFDPTTWVHYLS